MRQRWSSEVVSFYALYVIVAAFILAPIAFIGFGSLRDAPPGLPGGYTFKSFAILFRSDVLQALINSLKISTGTTLVAVTLGVLLATATEKIDLPLKKGLFSFILLPSFITPFIGAVGWVLLLSPQIGYINKLLGLLGLGPVDIYSMWGIIFVMGIYYVPVVYLFSKSALEKMDASMEEASRIYGATFLSSLATIIWPLIMPAILSSAVVVFVSSIGQFGTPSVLGAGRLDVLPTIIVRLIARFPADPNLAAALGFEMIFFAAIGIWVQRRWISRREYTTVTGKGTRLSRINLGRWGYFVSALCWGYVACAVILPVAAILISSFFPYMTTEIADATVTLRGYKKVLIDSGASRKSIFNSLILALSSATVATVLGGLFSFINIRSKRIRGHGLMDTIVSLPLSVPHIVFGVGLLWVWLTFPIGVYGSLWILFIAYMTLFFPYAVRDISAGLLQVDSSLEEAARVYGSNWLGSVWYVTFPLVLPSLISGWILVFVHAIRELPASLLLFSSGSEVMATQIFTRWQEGYFDELFALASVLIVITLAFVLLFNTVLRRVGKGAA